jgi:hypothetical protein
MSIVLRDSLRRFIEPHFYKILQQDEYKLKNIKSHKLLTYNRLDIAFKLLYLEMRGHNAEFSENIYKEHIRAFSLGSFTEPGNKEKYSSKKFLEEFDKTFEDIERNGFNKSKSLIPLSINGSIVNGSHRVASAIFLNKDVDCVKIEAQSHIYDYNFFYSRNVSSEVLDIVTTKFIEYANNVHIAFLWPIENQLSVNIEELIPNIVYKKKIQLDLNGAHNLLSQIYYKEEWLGDVKNNFRGSQGKLVECFKNFNAFDVIAFQADSLDKVLKIKDDIREVFNVGKHSIHITDTKEEAVRSARIVFNNNSLHFLNYAKPNRYISTHNKIDIFKIFLAKNNIDVNDVSLCGNTLLSAYGLIDGADIDYLTVDDKLKHNDKGLQYYGEDKIEMVLNPKNYFYFNEIKFISFSQLYRMKKNRGRKKDVNDCHAMKSMIDNNKFNVTIDRFKQKVLYGKIKLKRSLIKYLKFIGLYSFAMVTYKKILK